MNLTLWHSDWLRVLTDIKKMSDTNGTFLGPITIASIKRLSSGNFSYTRTETNRAHVFIGNTFSMKFNQASRIKVQNSYDQMSISSSSHILVGWNKQFLVITTDLWQGYNCVVFQKHFLSFFSQLTSLILKIQQKYIRDTRSYWALLFWCVYMNTLMEKI